MALGQMSLAGRQGVLHMDPSQNPRWNKTAELEGTQSVHLSEPLAGRSCKGQCRTVPTSRNAGYHSNVTFFQKQRSNAIANSCIALSSCTPKFGADKQTGQQTAIVHSLPGRLNRSWRRFWVSLDWGGLGMRISNSELVALLIAALLAVAGGEAATATATTRGRMSVGRPHERRLAEQWCVAKPNLSDSAYQGVLDWVCGPLSGQGQVNCGPIQNGQSCYLPDSYQSHASWAMNAYYQAQGQSSQSCDFQGTATITTSNPSTTTCSYASPNGTSSSGNGTSGAMGNLWVHSRPMSYLSVGVSLIAYFTAQAL